MIYYAESEAKNENKNSRKYKMEQHKLTELKINQNPKNSRAMPGLFIKQHFAHKGQINDARFFENPDGIISCGSDKLIKLWSLYDF
jgi:hypothetical protein